MNNLVKIVGITSAVLLQAMLGAQPAMAQTAEQLPRELEGIHIIDRSGSRVPLDLRFNDENNNPVTLASYFNQGKPVILNLVYFKCPMLCSLVVNGMVDGLRQVKYSAGKDFTILTVSFNPMESAALANAKRRNYLELYDRSEAHAGWHFLTGSERNIRALAEAVGFGYKWQPERQEYAHEAGIFVLTPDGTISRTLTGVQFDPLTLRGSILEASKGSVGTPLEKVYFACLHFDTAQGKYTASVINFTRAVTLVIVLLTALTLAGFFRHELRQRRLRGAS